MSEKRTFEASRSAFVSFSLYEYDNGKHPHPRDIYKLARPELEDTAWVAQTVYDLIWVLYLFRSVREKEEFLRTPPVAFSEADLFTADQAFYDHWVSHDLSNPTAWKIKKVER